MCDIDICKSGDQQLIVVDEVIGDSSFLMQICQTCASIIGAREHQRLVDHVTNRAKLEQYWFGDSDLVDDPFK